MSVLRELFSLTKELHEAVLQPITEENRETIIQEVTSLLDKRDLLLQQVKGPYTDNEMLVGQEILKYNTEIDKRLLHIRQSLQQGLQQITKRKATNNRYANPYESVNPDGMFLDKRK